MSLGLILEIIVGILKFPGEMLAFVRLISKSPEEKRQEIMLQVGAWIDESSGGERPKWGG